MQRSVALIMFSNYESFGVVIGEAWSCGIPVISSNSGGLTERIDRTLGIRVNIGDEGALSRAFLEMCTNRNSFEPVRMRQVVLDEFSMPVIANKLQELYKEVLQQKQSSQ